MGFVANAIVPPRAAHTYIRRTAIENFWPKIDRSRLTTVSGPAGFGKTTAMLRWAELFRERGRPVIWVAGRAGVTDFQSFRLALDAGFAANGIAFDLFSPADVTHKAQLASFADWQGAPPVLFVDDLQYLDREVTDFLSQMMASARDSLTIVLASRGEPQLDVARLRSLGMLVEVRSRHLTFSSEEAAALLNRETETMMDPVELQRTVQATQGWAAGLVIASSAWWRDRDEGVEPSGSITGLRSEFASYFQEEIMERQAQDIRDFLVDTSILETLTPDACAAVTGKEVSRALLEEVFERGLFVAELDREQSCYRYYSMFREMVFGRMMRRAPQRAAELHRRASRYFFQTGDLASTLLHASMSKDQIFLADQLELLAEPMTDIGMLYRVDELASELPWDILSSRPALLLAMSWRRIRRLAFKSAERMIDTAEQTIKAKVESGEYDDYRQEQMDFHLRHRRVMLEAGRDNMPYVERESETLLADIGDDMPYLSCSLLAQLLSARRELYHFHDMLRLEAELRKVLGRPGSDFASIALKASVAPTLVAQGKTQLARQYLIEAHDIAKAAEGQQAGLGALPALPLAELYYECGDLDGAAALVEQYLPSVRQWGFVDQLASGYLVRARLAAAHGDLASALSGLEEAYLVAVECGLDRLRALVLSEQVRLLVQNGQVDMAEQLLLASDMKPDSEPAPSLNPTRLNEWVAIAWLRIEMHRFRLVRSRKIVKRWLAFVRRRGAVRSAVTFELLLAQIEVLSGNRSEARRAVRSAIELAEPGGWVRPFVDEGDAVSSLLHEAYGSGPQLDSPSDRFGTRLVSIFSGGGSVEMEGDEEFGLGSRLASREVEILSMVAGGLRNREIGHRLGLTEGTVKWYMQQIFDKLGVRRRPQAVIRARQLGLLT